MFKTSLLTGLVLSLGRLAVLADAPAQDVSHHDKKFVEEAASGGMMEVQLGQYAAANGANQDVKDFGQHMVDDHTKANEELRKLATSKGLDVPAVLSSKDQRKLDKLEKLKGADFDKKYMEAMVSDHKDDVEAFDKESKKGEDPDVKAFAEKTLPTLNHHLEMAKDISGKL